mmetsp:Transcript_133054/g.384876  ORF Transcript_133054/g.384876 Transcript_133054/m.384876 type:complete len:222 (-) Transcript_133054:131-796(-)
MVPPLKWRASWCNLAMSLAAPSTAANGSGPLRDIRLMRFSWTNDLSSVPKCVPKSTFSAKAKRSRTNLTSWVRSKFRKRPRKTFTSASAGAACGFASSLSHLLAGNGGTAFLVARAFARAEPGSRGTRDQPAAAPPSEPAALPRFARLGCGRAGSSKPLRLPKLDLSEVRPPESRPESLDGDLRFVELDLSRPKRLDSRASSSMERERPTSPSFASSLFVW